MNKPLSRSVHNKRGATPDVLDRLAVEALAYLAEDDDRLARFFADTGLSPADLRGAAKAPGFAASLLDHLATNEQEFVGFAAASGWDPDLLEALRRSLAPIDPDP